MSQPFTSSFVERHLGSSSEETQAMLAALDVDSLGALIDATVPTDIRLPKPLDLPEGLGEHEALAELKTLAQKNRVMRSFIGQGYHGCLIPPVIQRNILENPGWYTAYTPYQAEIAQGRLEALLNFQTMVCDLTGLPVANASLLDEATAAAEAMSMALAACRDAEARTLFASETCHPQTLAVLRTRAHALGLQVVTGDAAGYRFEAKTFAVLLQYPDTIGIVHEYDAFVERAHLEGALVIVAADPLSLTLLRPPGEFGADIAVGSMQRFGVPMGYGGPHAGYMAVRDELKRLMPGRLVGVSQDAHGKPAYRLSLQTREQHIRRDKATSNICTAQVLLGVMASMYAVWHGPAGLRQIATRVQGFAIHFRAHVCSLGVLADAPMIPIFDTVAVRLRPAEADQIIHVAQERGMNLRRVDGEIIGVTFDETSTEDDVQLLFRVFEKFRGASCRKEVATPLAKAESKHLRTSPFLTHPVFNTHHTEHEMLRYIRRLESRDLSLCHSMIPLGSCTMKLNATSQMLPVTWPEWGGMHPFAPLDQAEGYTQMTQQLARWLSEITGFADCLLEPNAGSQGEFAGLLVIRRYLESKGGGCRKICLIPTSAHGTNPASAVMAGMMVVPVLCRANGDIDLNDLRSKASENRHDLAALMVTYPSTHGVFEDGIREMCAIIHEHGGQVYLDGANMNAQVGLTSPGHIGADVCHLNLHKTFCIPHGGGGPGVGPICVAAHLVPHLHARNAETAAVTAISAAPLGSASILVIPWMFIRTMGAAGLTEATRRAILHANYISQRLDAFFPVLYRGRAGRVAHECIIDLRRFKKTTAEDAAKRLIDYGFHAPTLSWPVPGTLMIEPTESESQMEMDRLCDALIAIHAEMTEVEEGRAHATDNLLKNAPHTARSISGSEWTHPYSREQAAYPALWLEDFKFWPRVGRIDNVWGDRNLFCSCVPMSHS